MPRHQSVRGIAFPFSAKAVIIALGNREDSMSKHRFIRLGVLSLLGCSSTTLSTNADAVRIAESPPHHDCRELGDVSATGHSAEGDTESMTRSAQTELRSKTAQLGGNFVVVDSSTAGETELTLSGRALVCDETPTPTAPTQQTLPVY